MITVVAEVHESMVFVYVNQGVKSVWGTWLAIDDPLVDVAVAKAWSIARQLAQDRPKPKRRSRT